MLGQARVDVLDFELLAEPLAEFARLAAVEDEPFEGLGVFDDLFHFVFDAGEILLAQLVRAVEVVVVAVGQRRAEGQVHVGKEPHDGPRHDVCARVPQHAQGFGVAIGQAAGSRRAG